MKKFNNNGFSLIELLAAVVILGIITFVGVNGITKYIGTAKKDAYVSMMNKYISTAKSDINSGKYKVRFQMGFYSDDIENNLKCKLPPAKYSSYYNFTLIPLSIIDLNKNKSPYKKNINQGYVVILNNGSFDVTTGEENNKYVYAIVGYDAGNNGIYNFVKEADLSKDSIKVGKTIPTSSDLYKFNNKFETYLDDMTITTTSGTNNESGAIRISIGGYGTYQLYSICR